MRRVPRAARRLLVQVGPYNGHPLNRVAGDSEVLFASQDGVQTFSLLWALGEDFEKLFEVAERVRLVLAADEVMHPLSQAGIRGMRGTKWLD